MPAYRSEAEAEIRKPVVAKFRKMIPGCRIIHEINAESFGHRIDVLAVGVDRIAACEIKSEKDKLGRLKGQVVAMKGVTHEVFAALHFKHLDHHPISGYAAPYKHSRGSIVWAWPLDQNRPGQVELRDEWMERERWVKPRIGLPATAINILHRNELLRIVQRFHSGGATKFTMQQLRDMIRWSMTGSAMCTAICEALRARDTCAEADKPIIAEPQLKQGMPML